MNFLPKRLQAPWDEVRTSLWLVPTLFFVAGVVLGPTMVEIDRGLGLEDQLQRWWFTSGSGADASNLLSTLLTSIIAMASMVFSVTVVALSLAASSYGPRLIRVFRSDLRTQLVVGLLVLTIVYLVIVLRSIRGDMDVPDVPHLSVTLGAVLSLACVLALLAFLQVVAHSMVADEVVRKVRREFDTVIKGLPDLRPRTEPQLPVGFEEGASRIRLPKEGYVQSVDYERLQAWATRTNSILRLDFRPGDFVVGGDRKVLVYPARDPDRTREEIAGLMVSGQERTPTQDIEFAIRHLVEVAVRALSPGINDPFTAMAVIDRLRGGLARLAQKQLPPAGVYDENGFLRIFRRVTDYAGAVDAALNQIRQAGSGKPSILIHMAEAIGEIASHLRTREQEEALSVHLDLILAAARRDIVDGHDLRDVEEAVARSAAALRASGRD